MRRATSPARATCPRRMARAVRAALAEHARRHPRLPARHGGDPPHPGGAGGLRCAGAAAAWRSAAGGAGPALRPAERRRVVLATSIAETSLTVPGVRIVVDGGWRRAPRLDPSTGLTRLATLRISRAAADQRAGRAGREAPGVAIRLWSAALHRGLPPHSTGRRSSRRSCRRWCWTAPPGAPRRPTCRSSTRRRRARWPPRPRC